MPIQFQNNFFEDERWVEAGPEAFAVWIYACEYSDRRNLDGLVPRAMLSRVCLAVSHNVIEDAIETLLKYGFFSPAQRGNSVRIVGFLEEKIGLSAAEKDETRQAYRDNQRRYRQHRIGNHELCNPAKCPEARAMSRHNVIQDNIQDKTGDTTADKASDKPVEFQLTRRDVTGRDVTGRSPRTSKSRNVKRNSDSPAPPESSGSAGATPEAPEPSVDPLVFEGTQVQVATLLPEQVDPRLPQLAVETADGDADAVFVSLPGDDLEGPAGAGLAGIVRAANRRAAEAMRGWGSVSWDAEGHYWLVCQADYETQVAYAKAFTEALDGVWLEAGA